MTYPETRVRKNLGSFSIGHRLHNYNGPCAYVHGHNYNVEIEAVGIVDPMTGFVVDFTELKKLKQVVDFYDHRLVLYENDPLVDVLRSANQGHHLVTIPNSPTVENLAASWFAQMRKMFNGDSFRKTELTSITVRETDSSIAQVRL